MKDLHAIIRQIDSLAPIPQVAHKVLSIAQDPKGSPSEMSEIILYDQALTANLLKICNSAYFGLPKKIESVRQGIVLMGINRVVDIVIMMGAADNLKRQQHGYDLPEGELWKSAVSCALVAKELVEKKGLGNIHLVFTAALLKDIGKVVLGQYVAGAFEEIDQLVREEGYSFREAEAEVIGIDHAQLGGMVAEAWKFSPKLVEIIRNHHMSEETSNGDLEVSIVHLADTLCLMMGIGVGSDGMAYRFHRQAADCLGFAERHIQEVLAGFFESYQRVEALVGAV
jgi:putative nucleotidyltransferase with HDIG domain